MQQEQLSVDHVRLASEGQFVTEGRNEGVVVRPAVLTEEVRQPHVDEGRAH
ncbi:MAG: hypothetical protein ABJA86_03005 [Nocardioidaceae bacterium]